VEEVLVVSVPEAVLGGEGMTEPWSDFEAIKGDRMGERVLDKGYVILVDHMGNDESIVQAARISTAKGTKSPKEDRGLIRYLLRNRHTTPFEMVEFKFLVKCPMFVWRQWIRHRTASVNEMSGRYVELPDEFFQPTPESIRKQSTSMKQGRSDEKVHPHAADVFARHVEDLGSDSFDAYHEALNDGIARETARVLLPLSTYTVAYWKIDLHNLLHFLELRLDHHAQEEIRVYAEAIGRMVQQVCPVAWEAFEDFQLNSVSLSVPEQKLFTALLFEAGGKKLYGTRDQDGTVRTPGGQYDQELTFDPEVVGPVSAELIPGKNEREECLSKLKGLGFVVREKS
jgi:thymidylate synthase (FAD)